MESNDKTTEETEGMEMEQDLDMEQSFESLFESSMQELNVGDVVRGTIVQVNDDNVVVDVGYKSEGVIPLAEFKDEHGKIDVKVGDEIDVLFERRENDSGLIGLSKEKADRQKIWGSLEEGAVVEGKIVGRIKGGLTVDIGINAFLPGSQVDLRPVRNLEKLLDTPRDGALLRYALGTAYLQAGRAEPALAQLREALARDPSYSAAWKALGNALVEAGREAEALETWRRGIAAAREKGDRQAEKEMTVFARRLEKRLGGAG